MGKLEFEVALSTRLEIGVPMGDPEVRVRAVAIPLKTYYRMDLLGLGQQPVAWPLGDVVVPSGLTSARLGLFAYKDTRQGRLYLPVEVRDARTSATKSHGPPTMTLRSDVDLENLKWRFGKVDARGACCRRREPCAQLLHY